MAHAKRGYLSALRAMKMTNFTAYELNGLYDYLNLLYCKIP